MSFSKTKYGTRTLFGTLGLCYGLSHWLDANRFQRKTCPTTTDNAKQRPQHDRGAMHWSDSDAWPTHRFTPTLETKTRTAWEHLHQWLQPSKQPNVAPFGRLDGWSTGGWDPLQN